MSGSVPMAAAWIMRSSGARRAVCSAGRSGKPAAASAARRYARPSAGRRNGSGSVSRPGRYCAGIPQLRQGEPHIEALSPTREVPFEARSGDEAGDEACALRLYEVLALRSFCEL